MAWLLISTLGISLGYSLSREISISIGISIKRTQKTILGTITGYGTWKNTGTKNKQLQYWCMSQLCAKLCKIYILLPAPLDSANWTPALMAPPFLEGHGGCWAKPPGGEIPKSTSVAKGFFAGPGRMSNKVIDFTRISGGNLEYARISIQNMGTS